MDTRDRMNFGIFMAPFHRIGDNPTYALRRDLELIEFLDHLSYDEAWIGEHHSAGYEIIPSPEVFIAAAAERTRHIRLGTGVCSLPYHHPLILADRMILLDHLTLGRAMFGVGPGALPSDAFMMGIDPLRQREMMDEALEAILALFRADEPVTRECGWFTLRDARLHMRPYTRPHMEMAVAAQVSPAGARAAGKYGLGLLSLGATTAGGFDVLGSQWAVAEEMAAEHGKTVERARWRLVGPMHLAPTMDQARADVAFGLPAWVDYFQRVAALPLVGDATELGDMIDAMNQTGLAVIGTPDDAAAQIERLWEKSGGFGTYPFMAHDWADREATLRSYELFARFVMPRFQGTLPRLARSRDWAAENRRTFLGRAVEAIGKARCVLVYRSRNRGSGGRPWAGTSRERDNIAAETNETALFSPYGFVRPVDQVAMFARRFLHERGYTSRHLGWIAVACRRHASNNPVAMMREPITVEDHQRSRLISDPLRLLDCCLETDGAAAVIVAAADMARDLRQKPAYIMAASQGMGPRNWIMNNFFKDPFLESPGAYAARDLWRMAGVGPKDVHVAQLYDAFTPLVLGSLEEYGFCAPGEAGAFVEDHGLEVGGRLPTNTSGGSLWEGHVHGIQ